MLVVLEVALAMILLAGSGLLIRSWQAGGDQPRFDPQYVLTLRLTIPPGVLEESMPAFYVELIDPSRALPGVVNASSTAARRSAVAASARPSSFSTVQPMTARR